MNFLKTNFSLFVLLLLFSFFSNAQDPARFQDQVDELFNKEYNFSPDKKLVVFAGSSSIRMWNDVQSYFPGYNVINNGFGGSHFSDLIFYYDKLILKRKPDILLIYEGDNDLAGNKKPRKILKEAKELSEKVRKDLPETRIIFISPKPSISRIKLKNSYISFNKKLKKYCDRSDNPEFADVWYPMLDTNGNVFKDVFLEDGLHMNKKGYDIWGKVIGEFLKE